MSMLCISAVCGQVCAPEGNTQLALMLLFARLSLSSPPFLVDTRTEGKQSGEGKPNIFLKTS